MTGFTAVDFLAVFGAVAFLFVVLLPALTPRRRGCHMTMNCVSNLKQVGLAMRMWGNDHQDKFPFAVSTNEGGTLELIGTEVFAHFLAISNELSSPKVLFCREDTNRTRAVSWDQFTNDTHLSYFVGLDADETRPQSILRGDRNLTTNGRPAIGHITLTPGMRLGWSPALHRTHGNIALGDGSAQQLNPAGLNRALTNLFFVRQTPAERLAIP